MVTPQQNDELRYSFATLQVFELLPDNTGHGTASCPTYHLHRYGYDGVHSFDDDDLHNTWLHVVNTDYNDHIDTYNHVHIDVHIDADVHVHVHIDVHIYINVHNDYINYNNNRMCSISRSNS
ncbi:hypothetical protein WR25_26666 [Diploscapter pachys]|uniref:Uncharacterized protein n=1 Tax=Diploscapter pachys TaxID=2018661 RepID=A0A2A2KHP1_9BILA|nr:hypothetical protein WR25_26666 [Diploscapter pachys]